MCFVQIQLWSVLQKQRQAEAINGALAMIGLTVGLVVEGRTGKGILGQVLNAECIRNSVCSMYKFFYQCR